MDFLRVDEETGIGRFHVIFQPKKALQFPLSCSLC
uniref:Uncharacterized protein n=1 Tax=Arundo donax TaxID=35708 RepID=A0A0A9A3V8_ARUDO